MVVALLAMLFVAGIAFLQSVTFEARQIDAQVEDGQVQAAVDAVEAGIFAALSDAWLGPNGKPYQTAGPGLVECVQDADANGTCDDVNDPGPQDDYRLTGPAYGELPYLHGHMAPLEPLEYLVTGEPGVQVLPYAGDIGPALRGRAARLSYFFDGGAWIELNNAPPWAVDADGDGVPDSRELELTAPDSPIRLPSDVREMLLERLNDPSAAKPGIFLSVRAIPHGAMVDINWSHPELVFAAFPEQGGDAEFPGPLRQRWNNLGRPYHPYFPPNEEASLRHRGGLPARRLSEAALQRDFAAELLGLHGLEPAQPGTFDAHRWWFHDLSETGADPEYPLWFSITAAPLIDGGPTADFSNYDRRHLITTYSTDNLLMRDGTYSDPNKPNYGRGWIEMIPQTDIAPGDFRPWALDDYPPELPDGDPRKGRMQISLPSLEVALLGDPTADPVNNGVNSLRAKLADSTTNNQATQFIRTIQEAFLLMLRNADPNIPAFLDEGGADMAIPRLAASLTANLIDFADSDDIPTAVDVIDTNGALVVTGGIPQRAYGLERQPFITEVYTKVVGVPDDPVDPNPSSFVPDPAQSFSGVELYNPYDVPLNLTPVLPTPPFRLVVTSSAAQPPIALGGTIPARGFAVVVNNRSAAAASGVTAGSNRIVIEDPALGYLQSAWTVELTRALDASATIVVDRFVIDSSTDFPAEPWGLGLVEQAQERGMWRVQSAPTYAYWTAVVPVPPQVPSNVPHTLGAVNEWQGQDSASTQIVRPVQVDVANAGSLRGAFPTTGTLLLLSRYANTDTTPFNDAAYLISNDVDPWKRNQYQLDNGRMPVFDTAAKHRRAQVLTSSEMMNDLPMGYPYLPWGQYVFDYFTALPLETPVGGVVDPEAPPVNEQPVVEASGARVYGRVNINAAPWTVLAGLPLAKSATLSGSFRPVIEQFAYPKDLSGNVDPEVEFPLGEYTAKAIVAYREARRIPGDPNSPDLQETGDFSGRVTQQPDPEDPTLADRFPPTIGVTDYSIGFGELRKGSGFLTVGELANVRHWQVQPVDGYTDWRLDGGVIGRTEAIGGVEYPAEDYVQAVGLLVALGDWATTRSDVWTVYGTLRGDRGGGQYQAEVDQRAIRFETTVDRMSSFLEPGSSPRRIGERKVGAYNDTRSE